MSTHGLLYSAISAVCLVAFSHSYPKQCHSNQSEVYLSLVNETVGEDERMTTISSLEAYSCFFFFFGNDNEISTVNKIDMTEWGIRSRTPL